jgi:putative transcriptional regulator
MERDLFEDLLQSLKEAKAIAKGEADPVRPFERTPPDGNENVALKKLP